MSIRVFERLNRMGIETTHEDRLMIDREIEARTGLYCDEGIKELTDEEFKEIINKVKKKKRVLVYA